MTETQQPEPDAQAAGSRALAKRVESDGDSTPFQLPGYLAAVPSIVEPGQAFTFAAEYADELAGQAETFEVAGVIDDLDPDTLAALREEVESLGSVPPAVSEEIRRADERAAAADESETEPVEEPVVEEPEVRTVDPDELDEFTGGTEPATDPDSDGDPVVGDTTPEGDPR